jgi:hypothetical protein
MSRSADITHETCRTAATSGGPAGAALAGLLIVAVTCGCQSAKPVYEPQPAPAVLAAGLDDPDNYFTILAAGVCGVRFPTTLAIAELPTGQTPAAAEGTQDSAAGSDASAQPPARMESSANAASGVPGQVLAPDTCCGPQLAAISPADQGRWVEAFRGLNFVRDLRFLSPIDLKSQCGDVSAILAAADRAGAGLLLTYAPNRCGPNSERIVGIMYAVNSGRPLAQLQAHMQFLNDKGEECSVDEKRGDYREQDAVYQAGREFKCRSAACVRELACRTSAATTTEPHRWIPLYPYCWQPLPRPQPSPQPCPSIAPAVPAENP